MRQLPPSRFNRQQLVARPHRRGIGQHRAGDRVLLLLGGQSGGDTDHQAGQAAGYRRGSLQQDLGGGDRGSADCRLYSGH